MKSKIHVFSRMFTEKFAELAKVNMFLFVLFAVLMSQSAWAANISVTTTGQSVNMPTSGSTTATISSSVKSFKV